MAKNVNTKFTKRKIWANIHLGNQCRLNNEKKPTSNPEFSFIYLINTVYFLSAISGNNSTSMNKGKPMILICSYLKPLLDLSLVLIIASYIFHFFFFASLKSGEKSSQSGKYLKCREWEMSNYA